MTENIDFTASTAYPLFLRSYSRTDLNGTKESSLEAKNRAIKGLEDFGLLKDEEVDLIKKYFYQNLIFPSGRWFWIGGTNWVTQQKNFIGAYNCASVPVDSWEAFRFNFRALLMGCGVGTIVEKHIIEKLPSIKHYINVVEVTELGTNWEEGNTENDDSSFTAYKIDEETLGIIYTIGDSKEGWVDIATDLLEFSSNSLVGNNTWNVGFTHLPYDFNYRQINLSLDLSYVRPKGKLLKSFGGLSNPEKLIPGLLDMVKIINGAVGRKLNSIECCKLLCIAGVITVVADIRRSALLHQGTPNDNDFTDAKLGLWYQDEQGNWKADPDKDMLRMANLTVSYHVKPDLETTIEAVRKQYYSGEGAIQYVPEAVARANADLLDTPEKKVEFINAYVTSIRKGANYLKELSSKMDDKELEHRIRRYGLNPSLRGDAKLLTTEGYKTLEELEGKTFSIINPNGDISESKVWQTGVKETVELSLSTRTKIYCTPDHIFKVGEEGLPAEWLKGKQLTPYLKVPELPPLYRVLGFIQGDGVLSQLAANSVVVCIGKKDGDILDLLDEAEIEYKYHSRHSNIYNLNKYLYSLDFDLNTLITRTLPKTYSSWTKENKSAFLNGLYSANGTVIKGGRVAFKTVCKELADQLVYTLKEDFNISAYITTNKPTSVKFDNGTYLCKMSYDVNIQQYDSRCLFFNNIGFSIKYKTERLANYLLTDAPVVRMVKPAEVTKVYDFTEPLTNWGVVDGFVTHNCGEIVGNTFFCCLSDVHANLLDPSDLKQQEEAFRASTLTALPLLQHKFDIEELRYSREIDPIIGVCITGLFDFFVNLFGADWLIWWKIGRDKSYEKANYFLETEREYLTRWKNVVKDTVIEFCERNRMRVPNRYTAIAPSGSKSLLTGASAGWHPPKATRYIRRITYRVNDPVALACRDYGYSIIPSQDCKDEEGNLLNDPYDPRVTEWLVEIPVEVNWAKIGDEADFNPKDCSALAQLDFYMQVHNYYVTHSTSATIELSENEIEPLGTAIHDLIENDKGYISAALLAKFEAKETFPRLPFEPISEAKYLELMEAVKTRQLSSDFVASVNRYSKGLDFVSDSGSVGCDSDKCLMPERK